MSLLRLIARLDIKGENVIKGVQMEGLRVIGKPEELAQKYATDGADEIIFLDTVASLYGRNNLTELLERTAEEVFIPITVAGGVRCLSDVKRLLGSGADKVGINTAAIRTPELIDRCAASVGCQGIVISIEAKRTPAGGWEAYTDNGRERTGRDAIAWSREAVDRGAGEILITSVDRDGTLRGFDLELVNAISDLPVPVTACGGMGTLGHLQDVLEAGADAVAMASVLHRNKVTFEEMRDAASNRHVRRGSTSTCSRGSVARLREASAGYYEDGYSGVQAAHG